MNHSFDRSPQDAPEYPGALWETFPVDSATGFTEDTPPAGLASKQITTEKIIQPRLSLKTRPPDFKDTPPAGLASKQITTGKVIQPRLSLKMRQEPLLELSLDRQASLQPRGFGGSPSYSFDSGIFDDPEFDKRDTIPLMVLNGIVDLQGQGALALKPEIADATKNATIIGIGNLVGNVLKYCNSFLIQRGFGPASFGLYSLGMSVVTLALSVFNLGLDDAMVRYVSIYRTKKQSGHLRALAIFCSVAAGVAGILGALFILLYAPFLAATKNDLEIIPILQIMAILVPLGSIQGIWSGGLQGFKEFKWRLFSQRFVVPTVMIFVLIIVLIFYHDIIGVVLASIISTIVGSLLLLYFFMRKLSSVKIPKGEPKVFEVREWLSFAVPNFMTSITDTVLDAIDTMLLAYFAIPFFYIGQYAAANKISIFISMPLLSFNGMFAPTIAELFSMGETQKLASLFKLVTKWTIIFSLPIFMVATLFAKSLLGMSGPLFVDGWPLLIALAIGNLVNAGTGAVGYMLLMTGNQKLSFFNSLLALLVNLALGIILTPRFGVLGVAIATGLALALVNLLKLIQVQVLLRMNPYQWSVLKPLGAAMISGLITEGLLQYINHLNWYIDVLNKHLSIDLALVPVFLAMYTGLIILFKFNDEDKIVIQTLRKKLKRGKK